MFKSVQIDKLKLKLDLNKSLSIVIIITFKSLNKVEDLKRVEHQQCKHEDH